MAHHHHQKKTTMMTCTSLMMAALFLVAVVPASADVIEDCKKGCGMYKTADPPGRLVACDKSCDSEAEARAGVYLVDACNKACESQGQGDPAVVNKCKEPCAIIIDATEAATAVGACYRNCVTGQRDAAGFTKCSEACARAEREGQTLLQEKLVAGVGAGLDDCAKRCVKEGGKDDARVGKCMEACPPAAPKRR